jgi:hypothetical protein
MMMVAQAKLKLTVGENWLSTSQEDLKYLYVCTSEHPGYVIKIEKATLKLAGETALAESDGMVQTSAQDKDFLYFGTNVCAIAFCVDPSDAVLFCRLLLGAC